ncbi:MAG: cytochrome P450 [Thermobispora bispora]|uniref:Cytochrome P450 n=1 Tax=Thermobispora bispora (strain ATCC 19993 / DSM 43833 / CBS 139.67 / JCM 10125 / KCTC 9307 / NBRC 14880 / R51) TaxID=469371 RepID=D6Y1N5_THEBD|nr:cytochrome P450 [Thermobispora bispora DSM 43833]MBX6166413.1 cytochrome P450 [Thermobispora bispora]QSI48426.1 cytochrome P450 [Thermobispora bispora]
MTVTSPDVNIAALDFWARPAEERAEVFRRLRAQERPLFFPQPKVPLARSGKGFYALVRHADVVEASRNAAVFSNSPAVANPEPASWVKYVYGDSLENKDAPEHTRLRRIVSRAFAPRMMERLDVLMRRRAEEAVTRLIRAGGGDFVELVARPFTTNVICDLVGVPEEDRQQVVRWVEDTVQYQAVRADTSGMLRYAFRNTRAMFGLRGLVVRLARERRKRPGDDVVSALANADVNGERLTNRELGAFFLLLCVGGVDSPANALAHAVTLLSEHPGQRELLLSDYDRYIGGAVEEILRYSSPITQLQRTVKVEYELRGQPLKPGDKVVLFYNSANRDESVFPEPDVFDITRDPNPHVAFGGPGAHYCLGAHLAKREMTILLRELYTRAPGIRLAGPPEPLTSTFNNAVRRLPVTL